MFYALFASLSGLQYAAKLSMPSIRPIDALSAIASGLLTDSATLADARPSNSYELWHQRFGHFSYRMLRNVKSAVIGMDFTAAEAKSFTRSRVCEGCALGKMHLSNVKRNETHLPHTTITNSSESKYQSSKLQPGQLILADLIISPVSSLIHNYSCSLVLVDAATRYTWVYPMKSKDETANKIQDWFAYMRSHGRKVEAFTTIKSDNGGEFTSVEFVSALDTAGVKYLRCPPYMHVPIAERTIQTIQETARSMLHSQSVPLSFWADAVSYAVHVINRTVTKVNKNTTRYELFHGVKPDVSKLRTFGCTVYARYYDIRLKKWDPVAFKGRFVGINDSNPNSWKLFKQITHNYVYSSSVIFDENKPTGEYKSPFIVEAELKGLANLFEQSTCVHEPSTDPLSQSSLQFTQSSTQSTSTNSTTDPTTNPSVSSKRKRSSSSDSTSSSVPSSTSVPTSPTPVSPSTNHYNLRSSSVKSQFLSTEQILSARALSSEELKSERSVPKSYKQAIQSTDRENWLQSIKREIESLFQNNTFTIMRRPANVPVIGLKWVFRIKENKDGTIERYKSRCCALGNLQDYYYDLLDTFAPVVRYSTVRMLLAVAASKDLILHHMDVDTAFLYGVMPESEPTYVTVPEDYPIPNHLKHVPRDQLVAKCNKAIYGLKQAPRLWNKNLDATMRKLNFTQSDADPCLYSRISNGQSLYVTIFVDDLLIAGSNMNVINSFKQELKSKYRMKDLGELNYFLGMEVSRDKVNGTIKLSQHKYTTDVLRRFGFLEAATSSLPMSPGLKLFNPTLQAHNVTDANASTIKKYPYREVIGSLMYLQISTRPDLAYSVCYLSRFLNSYDTSHIAAANQILRYLKATQHLGIVYSRNASLNLYGYSDSDWASDVNNRRSTTGYVFFMAGGAISWKSSLQSTVALSTSEAEYMALSACAQESIALQYLCASFNLPTDQPVQIFEDNSGAIAMANNPVHYAKTKHIHIRHHFIRECVDSGRIIVTYIPTAEMTADILTKALPSPSFSKFRSQLLNIADSM